MTEEIPSIQILFSDEFKDRLRSLAKRYRSIRTDLQPLIDDLQAGNFIGDQIQEQATLSSKFVSKTATSKRVKVAAIVLFINLETIVVF